MAVSFLPPPLPAPAAAVKEEEEAHMVKKQEQEEEGYDEEEEASNALSDAGSSGSSVTAISSAYHLGSTILTSSSASSSSLSDDDDDDDDEEDEDEDEDEDEEEQRLTEALTTAAAAIRDTSDAALHRNSGAQLGAVDEASGKASNVVSPDAAAPAPHAMEGDNAHHQQQQHAGSLLEDMAALDKIVEESEHMSQFTTESELEEAAAAAATANRQPQQQQQQQQQARPGSYARPTVISSFTTTSSASLSTAPSLMSQSHDGGSTGTEIGWTRDGRAQPPPPPFLDVAAVRAASPADFSIAGIGATRRNLRHSGPMPPPSRPLYSPASSPNHVKSGAQLLPFKSKSEHPSPRSSGAPALAPAPPTPSAASRDYGARSVSPVKRLFGANPAPPPPGRSFYHAGFVSPARTYNPPDFASRAFGHQVFGTSKPGKASLEQGKSQLANLEEELSTLLRNRASNRRSAAAASTSSALPSRLPLPPAGRRGFSMELHKGSHMFGVPALAPQPAEPVPVHYSDGEDDDQDEYEDEEGDAVYEESMRELDILVRAGSRFNDIATSKRTVTAEPHQPSAHAPLQTLRPDKSGVSSSSSRDQQPGAPVEKQVVHVELPAPSSDSRAASPSNLSWTALSKFGPSPDNASVPNSGDDPGGPNAPATQQPRTSPSALHMSQRSQRKVLKPLGDDGNSEADHPSSASKSWNKDVQALVSRVSWSSKTDLHKSRSLDDSALPDKIAPLAREKIAAEVSRANLRHFLKQDTARDTASRRLSRQDSRESSSRRLSKHDSMESSLRRLSKQDAGESSSRRLSRQVSRDPSMRKPELLAGGASLRKSDAEAGGTSTTASRLGNNAALERNFPSFKTLNATTCSSPPKASPPACAPPDDQLDASVLASLENVALVRLRGSRRYYGSFADSETDGAHIDLTASPAARFLEDSSVPDDFSQPFRISASVPFKWEEAPGKPKSPTTSGQKAYPLQPPPRLQLVSGPLLSGATSPGPNLGQQHWFSGPQETDSRSPPRQPEQRSRISSSGISPKRHSLKNVGMPSPENNKKGISLLQNLLHGGCTLSDVATVGHGLRLPVPPSKEEVTRVCRNIDMLAAMDGDRDSAAGSSTELHILSKVASEDGLSPSSVLFGPAEISCSSGSLSSSHIGKDEGPDHLGSFQCFSNPRLATALKEAVAGDVSMRQHSMKRNRSLRDAAAANIQVATTDDDSRSKNHSDRRLGSILNADGSKSGSSRAASGRSSRRLRLGSERVSMGRLPSMRGQDYPGSGSEWEETTPKSPGTPRPLAKKRKSDGGRAMIRVRRFPRFMKTLKRAMRRAFCLGSKSRLGNSQRYTTTPSTMYAITLS